MVKILLVEDSIKISESIHAYLTSTGYEVVCVQDGQQALNVFNDQIFDLVLLDLMLPKLSGEEVCKKIRSQSEIPIIMITAKVAEEDLLHGLGIGADDYIIKPFGLRTLKAKIEVILKRTLKHTLNTNPQNPSIEYLTSHHITIHPMAHEVRKDGQLIALTPHEMKILMVLAKSPNQVFTREMLIEQAFEGCFDGYDRAIDVHIKNIRQKLEANPKEPELIKTVYGVGYKIGGKPK